MVKNCENCGKYRDHNVCYCSNELPYCSAPVYHKWVPVRDIRQGVNTGKILDCTDISKPIVLHRSDTSLSKGQVYTDEDMTNTDSFIKLNYSEYVQYLPKEEKEIKEMKYELTDKKMTGKTVAEAGAYEDELEIFIEEYGYNKEITYDENTEKRFDLGNGWLDFALENGFIQEIKPKIGYKTQKVYIFKNENYTHKLHKVKDGYIWIGMDSSVSYWTIAKTTGQAAIDYVIDQGIVTEYKDMFEWAKTIK